jgi:sRNA-binding protein
MPSCIALLQSRESATAWEHCTRAALRGDRFCAAHRHALDGAVMGFLDTKDYRHAQTKFRTKALRKSARRKPDKPRAQRAALEIPAEKPIKARPDTKTLRRFGRKIRAKSSATGAALAGFLGT